MKITPYSARIGLATMMMQRGFTETEIYDFGAWARLKSASAMSGYVRMSLEKRVRLVKNKI